MDKWLSFTVVYEKIRSIFSHEFGLWHETICIFIHKHFFSFKNRKKKKSISNLIRNSVGLCRYSRANLTIGKTIIKLKIAFRKKKIFGWKWPIQSVLLLQTSLVLFMKNGDFSCSIDQQIPFEKQTVPGASHLKNSDFSIHRFQFRFGFF